MPQRLYFTAFILLAFVSAASAQQPVIKNLVFEGAGVRGIAYAGVLDELEKEGILENIEQVGGTSAGAITALMVSLGYTPEEIREIISETQIHKFNDGEYIFFGGFHRLSNHFGWYKRDKFLKWLDQIILNKTPSSDLTFSDLYEAGFTDLYVTATCLNKQKLLVLSRETYPEMRVKDAVMISMAIPLYFEAVFIDSIGKVYDKPDNIEGLDIVMDGGITGNYPIFLFDSVTVNSNNEHIRIPNHETLGVRMDSESQIEKQLASQSSDLVPLNIDNFSDYISAFYIFVIENLNRNQLVAGDWERTISISSIGIGPKVKRLSQEEKNSLIESGRKGTEKFFSIP